MRFPPSFLEEIRNRLPVSQVAGRRVKLKKAGREWRGLSPFNKEKTPSFFVNDAKARWFDFSAGTDGDVFAFVMQTEGLTFPDAVERLAGEAGVPMPKADPESVKREARKLSLIEVNEYAARYFAARLAEVGEGDRARLFLAARKINPQDLATFRIGFAPADAAAFGRHLKADGVEDRAASDAGLMRDGDSAICRFRNRIVFPICDLKGHVVGFGGRVIDGETKPKYLNTPETPIFSKGQILFNAHRARQPAWDGEPVIVCEGFVDVVAIERAGFRAAVAPMGTSLTEAHLHSLWRLTDEPILCFDGDGAGRRAMKRSALMSLPMLKPGRSLRFALMPLGQDPDDVITKRGPETFSSVVKNADPLMDVLWRTTIEGKALATPEQRAGVADDLDKVLAAIPDDEIRGEYRRDMRRRMKAIPNRIVSIRTSGAASPSAGRLAHGLERSSLTLSDAMFVAALVSQPGAGIEALEAMDGALSPAATDAVNKIVAILGDLPDAEGPALIEALRASGAGLAIEEAFSKVHAAGIYSLDPGKPAAAALAVLRRQ